jgi:methylated-DNA-[protein]-cysteine S-methyltransferase
MGLMNHESSAPHTRPEEARAVPDSKPETQISNLLLVPFPAGRLLVAYDDAGVREVRFWPNDLDTPPETRTSPTPDDALGIEIVHQLRRYFAGELREFALPLATEGTRFQWRVWEALCRIPLGETRSYAEIARAIGNPRAARAAGQAIRRNRLPIIVPCHRVITASGALGGYMGGAEGSVEIKRWLLEHERRF